MKNLILGVFLISGIAISAGNHNLDSSNESGKEQSPIFLDNCANHAQAVYRVARLFGANEEQALASAISAYASCTELQEDAEQVEEEHGKPGPVRN